MRFCLVGLESSVKVVGTLIGLRLLPARPGAQFRASGQTLDGQRRTMLTSVVLVASAVISNSTWAMRTATYSL